MKKLTLIMVFCTLSFSLSADVYIQNGFITGNQFNAMSESDKRFYSMGLLDGMFLAPLFTDTDSPKSDALRLCVPKMTDHQIAAIFNKYLREHPESWHEYMHLIAWRVMAEVCNL